MSDRAKTIISEYCFTQFKSDFKACFVFRDDFDLESDRWFWELTDAYIMWDSDFRDIETVEQWCCWMYKDYTLRDHGFQLREDLLNRDG